MRPLAIGPHALPREGIPLKKLPRCCGLYLICFDVPYTSANGKKTVRHYLGFAKNLRRRLEQHQAGTHGARLMQVINAAGITWTVTHLWLEAGRIQERRLKNLHK